jgi:hypothetical protein
MSLLAATTLGVSGVDQVRAHVSTGQDLAGEGELRLIVQSYRRGTLGSAALPGAHAEPVGSTQRAITAEELRHGVDVSLLSLPDADAGTDRVIVAWVERGSATLDYDAREARPGEGAYCAVASGVDGEVALRLV